MLVFRISSNKVCRLIIKKIYFHNNSYSENKANFKKLLSKYSVIWDKRFMMFHNINSRQIMTGVYSNGGSKKVAAVYGGSGEPVTMVV